jgi:hypothetical protein
MNMESRRTTATLAAQAGAGANVVRIAQAIGLAWQEIDGALSPIVGRQGVAALYYRSIHIACARHRWLAAAAEPAAQASINYPALATALLQQTSAEAAACGTALLLAFQELLVGMIGATLSAQLLRSADIESLTGAAGHGPLL